MDRDCVKPDETTSEKMDRPEFYAMLARDFLEDEDAGPNKLAKYMEIVPK